MQTYIIMPPADAGYSDLYRAGVNIVWKPGMASRPFAGGYLTNDGLPGMPDNMESRADWPNAQPWYPRISSFSAEVQWRHLDVIVNQLRQPSSLTATLPSAATPLALPLRAKWFPEPPSSSAPLPDA